MVQGKGGMVEIQQVRLGLEANYYWKSLKLMLQLENCGVPSGKVK